jgi:hypothetical protein
MSETFQANFNQYLHEKYPSTKARSLSIPDNLISPVVVKIKADILDQAQKVISACFEVRNLSAYQEYVKAQQSSELAKFDPKNYSLFMSYDFHLSGGTLKLIEINTNAAFSLVAWELYRFKRAHLPSSIHDDFTQSLKDSFRDEISLALGQKNPAMVAIVDDEPEQQKMFIEFAMFEDLFRSWGWTSEVCDIKDLKIRDGFLTTSSGARCDFVYNRSTNFLFENLPDLQNAYLSRKACVSPNPHEYVLLAEKNRLIDLGRPDLLKQFGLADTHIRSLEGHIPFMKDTKSMTADEVWQIRKKVFFKPKRAYAGKEVYKGAGITKRVFEQIMAGDFVAQELIPPPTMNVKLPNGDEQEFKYDLRFYAYNDTIQMITARLYQGQVTNFKTPGSGFTAIEIA